MLVLVLPHWSSWCCPCPAHHPTTGAASLSVPVLALHSCLYLHRNPLGLRPQPLLPPARSHSDSFSGLRLAEQLGRREDEAKIRHGLGLSLWASGNLEESQHQVHMPWSAPCWGLGSSKASGWFLFSGGVWGRAPQAEGMGAAVPGSAVWP